MDEPRVLVVEDDNVARLIVERSLRAAGFAVLSVADGETALEQLQTRRFDLVVTDLYLPGIDGVAVMVAARQIDPDIEVIMLTGMASLNSAIAAVSYGAFAYLCKPARPGELVTSAAAALARRQERHHQRTLLHGLSDQLRSLAERCTSYTGSAQPPSAALSGDALRVGILEIDPRRHLVTRDEQPLQLTHGEFALLIYLARHSEQVISPRQLVREVFGYTCSAGEARVLIKARVYRLRQKIEADPTAPQLLLSVRGAGYMLTAGSSA